MNKNILLVEYDEISISTIKELLSLPEIETTVVSDGESALRLLSKKPFDLVVTAAMLPRFHGFKLCQDVVTQYPSIPVIIISAIYKGLQYRHMAITQYKASDFFEKPLEKEKFKQRILELVNLKPIPEKEPVRPKVEPNPAIFSIETTRFPVGSETQDEDKKLTSEDLFGDIIDQVEKTPASTPMVVEEKKAAPVRPAEIRAKPVISVPTSATFKVIPVTEKPIVKEPYKKHEPVEKKTYAPFVPLSEVKISPMQQPTFQEPPATPQPAVEAKIQPPPVQEKSAVPPAAPAMRKSSHKAAQHAALLDALETKVKTQKISIPHILREKKNDTIPLSLQFFVQKKESTLTGNRLKKIEDDIMRKLDETLSGLGFAGAVKTPPKEEKPLVFRSDEFRTAQSTDDDWDYDILGLIARGGMAEIYKAKKKGHKGFEKIIAIKKILSGYGEDDKYIEMLIDEAKVAAQLSHPNIVHIYDLKKKDSFYFIVMEYVLGKDLRIIQRVLQEQSRFFPQDLAVYLMIKVLEALNYAHKASDSNGKKLDIVHRDVSPPNILISYNGDVKLADFGISKASIKIHQTVSGALKGKLLYMSPEQAIGEENIDYRSDLYSVGLILFELITGKKLFMDRTEMGILKKVQQGQVISPREFNPNIDVQLEAIVLKSLQKDKEKRYQDASDMITEMQAYLMKKYNTFPGPIHLSRFITDLFQEEIRKEGIKVEQKPYVESPLLPKPELTEKVEATKRAPLPSPVAVSAPPPSVVVSPPLTVIAPPKAPVPIFPTISPKPPPPLEEKTKPERMIVEINLDDDLTQEEKALDDQDLIITITSTNITLPTTTEKPDKEKKSEPPKKSW